jgi:hypothetical protein
LGGGHYLILISKWKNYVKSTATTNCSKTGCHYDEFNTWLASLGLLHSRLIRSKTSEKTKKNFGGGIFLMSPKYRKKEIKYRNGGNKKATAEMRFQISKYYITFNNRIFRTLLISTKLI